MQQRRHRIDAFKLTDSSYFNRMITAMPHPTETGRPNLGCVPVQQLYVSEHPVELLLDSGSINVIGAKNFRVFVAAGVSIFFQVEGEVFNTWFLLSASYEGDLLFSSKAINIEHFDLDIQTQWRARRVHFGVVNVMVQMIAKCDHPSQRA